MCESGFYFIVQYSKTRNHHDIDESSPGSDREQDNFITKLPEYRERTMSEYFYFHLNFYVFPLTINECLFINLW